MGSCCWQVGRLAMCGTSGGKFPGIRTHMQRAIGDVYSGTTEILSPRLTPQLQRFAPDCSYCSSLAGMTQP
jgi:hypothetical protein